MKTIQRSIASAPDCDAFPDTIRVSGFPPRLALLLKAMPHRTVEVDPRRPFRDPGAPRDEVMFLRSGILCKYKMDSGGRRQIVALRFRGETILPHETPAPYGVQAIVRSEVAISQAKDFLPILEAEPELRHFFWRMLQRNEAISYEWLINCGRRDSVSRVAHLLCETAIRSGEDGEPSRMTNPFTQQQIADITGQTSVNVNRVFADLERQGLITRSGREIRFLDWSEMRRVASFQASYLD